MEVAWLLVALFMLSLYCCNKSDVERTCLPILASAPGAVSSSSVEVLIIDDCCCLRRTSSVIDESISPPPSSALCIQQPTAFNEKKKDHVTRKMFAIEFVTGNTE